MRVSEAYARRNTVAPCVQTEVARADKSCCAFQNGGSGGRSLIQRDQGSLALFPLNLPVPNVSMFQSHLNLNVSKLELLKGKFYAELKEPKARRECDHFSAFEYLPFLAQSE